jgi:hypothetical protein
MEVKAGNLFPPTKTPPPFQDTYIHNVPTSAGHLYTLWSSYYIAIGRINNILYGIADSKNMQKLYAEALFLRAFLYFDLLRIYGDVPLITEPTQNVNLDKIYVSKTPKDKIYQQILSDLTLAEPQCPIEYATTAATKGRATKNAVKMLMAKVYMYLDRYAEAQKKLSEIGTDPDLLLVPLLVLFKINNNPESIWELQITSNTGHVNAVYLPRNLGGQNQLAIEPSFLRTFEKTDARLTNYMTKDNNNTTYLTKYQRSNAFQTDNIVLMRYAESILMYAECNARNTNTITKEALNILNAIRDRAELPEKKITDFANVNAFIDEVLQEKRKELAGENGETWFDMVRTNKAMEWNKQIKSKHLYLHPIPDSELRNNPNLTQNPGY